MLSAFPPPGISGLEELGASALGGLRLRITVVHTTTAKIVQRFIGLSSISPHSHNKMAHDKSLLMRK